MAVSYTCPNDDCRATLKSPNRVPAGKKIKCPKCGQGFIPEAADEPEGKPAAGTFKLADEPAKKAGDKKGPPKKEPEPSAGTAAPKSRFDDEEEDAESVKRGYGVVQETEEEIEAAERNKPSMTEIQDKFKKSARGPAIAMLVAPTNMMTGVGLLTVLAGLVMFVVGIWPLVFNDATPGDEELEDAIINMVLGLTVFGWGSLVCVGASQMQELSSYTWAMVGAVLSIPLLVGIFALVMLYNPRVKAGFEEIVGALDEDEDGDKDEDDDDDEDDD